MLRQRNDGWWSGQQLLPQVVLPLLVSLMHFRSRRFVVQQRYRRVRQGFDARRTDRRGGPCGLRRGCRGGARIVGLWLGFQRMDGLHVRACSTAFRRKMLAPVSGGASCKFWLWPVPGGLAWASSADTSNPLLGRDSSSPFRLTSSPGGGARSWRSRPDCRKQASRPHQKKLSGRQDLAAPPGPAIPLRLAWDCHLADLRGLRPVLAKCCTVPGIG